MPTRKSQNVEDFIIDFKDEVEGGGGGIRVKEGTYLVRILGAKAIESEDKGTPGLEIVFAFKDGKYKGKKITDRLWATPKAYSRFRTLLEACGKKVPARVNLVKIGAGVKGATLYIEIADETRDGYSTRSRVTFNGFIHPDDYDPDEDDTDEDEEEDDLEEEDEDDDTEEDEDEEEEPAPKRRARKTAPARRTRKKAVEDDDEDLDDLDLDDL